MYRLRVVLAVALFGTTLCATPRPALAADAACPALDVGAADGVRELWPELVAEVRDGLAARRDLEPCARITLASRLDATIDVEVALPDGRSAARTGLRREDVLPTLRALLSVPEARAVPARAEPERPAFRDAPALPARTDASIAGDGVSDPSQIGLELSLLTGARIGDGHVGVGFGAVSYLRFKGWLVGFEGRIDHYESRTNEPPHASLELGALFGKRFPIGNAALSIAAGPGFASSSSVSDIEVSEASMAPPGEPRSEPPVRREREGYGPSPRLLLHADVGFSQRSVLRTFAGIDGALGLGEDEATPAFGSSRLPSWTLGLHVGATLGTR